MYNRKFDNMYRNFNENSIWQTLKYGLEYECNLFCRGVLGW